LIKNKINGKRVFIHRGRKFNITSDKRFSWKIYRCCQQENDKEIAAAKQAERAERAQLWQEPGASLVNPGTAVNNLNSNSGGSSSGYTNNSGTSGRNTGTANTQSKADCGSAWRTDSRTYSDYESQLIRIAYLSGAIFQLYFRLQFYPVKDETD
jgi:hypothetical protein